jgi:hypothetical protein
METWSEVNLRSVRLSGGDRHALGTYRLMRLAGSVSFPSPRKQERGYVVEVTSALLINAPAYDLHELRDRFPAVERGQARASNDRSGGATTLRGNLYEPLPLNWMNVALVQSMLDALPVERNRFRSLASHWLCPSRLRRGPRRPRAVEAVLEALTVCSQCRGLRSGRRASGSALCFLSWDGSARGFGVRQKAITGFGFHPHA